MISENTLALQTTNLVKPDTQSRYDIKYRVGQSRAGREVKFGLDRLDSNSHFVCLTFELTLPVIKKTYCRSFNVDCFVFNEYIL